MKKTSLLLVGLLLMIGESIGGTAGAIFKAANKGQKLQIIIDKKIINAEPKSVVKIKGSAGLHQVKIRVYKGKRLFTTKEQLRIRSGYKNEFVVKVNPDRSLEIKRTRAEQMYKSIYKRPDKFYNRKYLADNSKGFDSSEGLLISSITTRNAIFDQSLLFVTQRKEEEWYG